MRLGSSFVPIVLLAALSMYLVVPTVWGDCAKSPRSTDQKQQESAIALALTETLHAMDEAMKADVLPLYDGVELVKRNSSVVTRTTAMMKNDTLTGDFIRQDKNFRLIDLGSRVEERLLSLLDTHVLRIKLLPKGFDSEGRRVRKNHHLIPVMLFGTLAVILILVPMGFKFLAVLGGKALLLSKMALLLVSIQGLKKVATSGINYGLYHDYSRHPSWHEKTSRIENNKGFPYSFDNWWGLKL